MDGSYELKTLGEYSRIVGRFEKFNDNYCLPDAWLIIRIDARRFGEEWRALPPHAYPFHQQVVDAFCCTSRGLFGTGFNVLYAYTHGDEISLLLDPCEASNLRKRSNIITLISSAAATLYLKTSGLGVMFHAEMAELPSVERVVDYFQWQRLVSMRNFISRYLGIYLSDKGKTSSEIDKETSRLTMEERENLLSELGYNTSSITHAERRGIGFWWESPGEGDFRLVECRELPVDPLSYKLFIENRTEGIRHIADCSSEDIPFEVRSLANGEDAAGGRKRKQNKGFKARGSKGNTVILTKKD